MNYECKEYNVIENGIEYIIEETSSGFKFWYYKYKFHRENGPAVELRDGSKFYYLHGTEYVDVNSDDEWIIYQIIK